MQKHVDASSSHSLDKLAEDAASHTNAGSGGDKNTAAANGGDKNTAAATTGSGTPQPSFSFADEPDQQQLPESLRKKTYANLYVQGLHASVTDALLGSWFKPFGDVRSSKVMLNVRTGVSRGFGFILFDDEAVGRRACDAMQGKVMVTPRHVAPGVSAPPSSGTEEGEDAVSTLVIEPSQHDGDRAAAESNVIYLRNIPAEVSERAAVAACAAYGKMQSFTMAPIVPRHAAARRKQRQQQQQGAQDAAAAGAGAGDDAAGSPMYAASAGIGGSSMLGAHSLDANAIAAVVEADRTGAPVSPKPPQDDALCSADVAAADGTPPPPPPQHPPHLYLATVEYETVDGARAAIRALHQSKPWPACGIPLLAKYADTEELKRHRQEQRKARQILLQKQQEQRDREKQEERQQRRKAASAAGSLAASPTALSAPSSLTAGSTPQRMPAAAATVPARDDDGSSLSAALAAAPAATGFGSRALRDRGGIGGSSVPVDGGLEYRAAEASQQPQRSPATSRRTNTGPTPQHQQPFNAAPQPPTQPGQVVYYKGTLQALGDGTFRMLAPELIKYQQHPQTHGASPGPTVSPPPPPPSGAATHRTQTAGSPSTDAAGGAASAAGGLSSVSTAPPELAHLATAAAAAAAAGAAQPPVNGVHIPAAAANPAAASIMYQQQQHAAATAAAAAAAVQQQVYFAQLAAAQHAAPPPLSAASMAAMQQQHQQQHAQQQQQHQHLGVMADPGPSVSEMPTPHIGPTPVADRNANNNNNNNNTTTTNNNNGASTPAMPADIGMLGASVGGNSFFGQHGLVPVTVGQSVGGTHQHMYVLPDVHGLGGGQSYSQSFRGDGGTAGVAAPAWQPQQQPGAGSLASSFSQLSRVQQQQQQQAVRASQAQQQPLPPAMQPGGGAGGRPSVGGASLGGADLLDLRGGADSPSHIET